MIVLSLFDGMSCGQIALSRAGIKVKKYYASEIDKYAIQTTQKNYPETIQLGNIEDWKKWDIEKPDLIIGGSPCQGFSFAGKQLNFDDPRSQLFFTFVEILKHFKPKYFLLENVKMKIEYERVITQYMNCYPIEINSALVSAQNRRRLYWTNIGQSGTDLFGTVISGIKQPEDKGILLKDILEPEVDEKYYLSNTALKRIDRKVFSNPKINPEKTGSINTKNNSGQLSVDSGTTLVKYGWNSESVLKTGEDKYVGLDANYYKGFDGKRGLLYLTEKEIKRAKEKYSSKYWKSGNRMGNMKFPDSIDKKSKSINAVQIKCSRETTHIQRQYGIRRLTPRECGRLQTVPEHILDKMLSSGVSDTQLYKMFGNGWTIHVIVHIFSYLKI